MKTSEVFEKYADRLMLFEGWADDECENCGKHAAEHKNWMQVNGVWQSVDPAPCPTGSDSLGPDAFTNTTYLCNKEPREVWSTWKDHYFPGKPDFSPVGDGWAGILDGLMGDIFALGWDGHIAQVKEKFGGLRFYVDGTSNEVHERIAEAEKVSYFTCEACGRLGFPRASGWIRTLCKAHAKGAPISDLTLYLYEGEGNEITGAIRLMTKDEMDEEKEKRRTGRASFTGNRLDAEG